VSSRQAYGHSRSALRAHDAVVLKHLPLADAMATAMAQRLIPLVEREDLIQVAREALVRSAPRCRAGEPPAPYLRPCITGALQHHLRDRVRLVRIPHRLHEQGQGPLGHFSLDASSDAEPCLLDQRASPEPEPASSGAEQQLALEQLVNQLPAGQATALRLTLLEGLSLQAAAERLQISAMSVQRAQKKAIAALRQLAGGGLGPSFEQESSGDMAALLRCPGSRLSSSQDPSFNPPGNFKREALHVSKSSSRDSPGFAVGREQTEFDVLWGRSDDPGRVDKQPIQKSIEDDMFTELQIFLFKIRRYISCA